MTLTHDHKRGHQCRAIVGKPGVWVQRHGNWCRPMNVWLYRGAWRCICFPCMTAIKSDDEVWDFGWPTLGAAMDAARQHCRDCSVPEAVAS